MTRHPHAICPASHSRWLDTRLRALLHNPETILGRYIRPHDTVLDIGCGPGYFTRAMARMVGEGGLVIAVDIQDEMLDMMMERAEQEKLAHRIRPVRAGADSLNLPGEGIVDFALAFAVVHEIADQEKFFSEVARALRPDGLLLVSEPVSHVRRDEFEASCELALRSGFRRAGVQKILMNRTVLLANAGKGSPTASTV